jgi:predicted SAM-dependent methyltransferase
VSSFLTWAPRRVLRGIHHRIGDHLAATDAIGTGVAIQSAAHEIAAKYDKINIGCGYEKLPGYLNVDVDPACSPELLIVGGDDSMIPRRHFREALAMDVLEHIPRRDTLRALLSWADYLGNGGRLVLQTTSILGVAARLQQMTHYYDHHSWTSCLFGNQAHPGDFHFTGFTELTLKVHLLAAGFRLEQFELRDDWLLYAEATRAESWTALCDAGIASDAEFTREAYRQGVLRDPRHDEIELGVRAIKESSRKEILKFIYASAERLHKIAEVNGL